MFTSLCTFSQAETHTQLESLLNHCWEKEGTERNAENRIDLKVEGGSCWHDQIEEHFRNPLGSSYVRPSLSKQRESIMITIECATLSLSLLDRLFVLLVSLVLTSLAKQFSLATLTGERVWLCVWLDERERERQARWLTGPGIEEGERGVGTCRTYLHACKPTLLIARRLSCFLRPRIVNCTRNSYTAWA